MPLSPSDPVWALAILVTVFASKHYVADFLLQTNWIAAGKECQTGWVLPLTAHAGCHGLFTLAIALAIRPTLWWLGPLDFAVHFLIDKGKATVGHAAQLTPQQEKFWWLLGLDQYLHQLTNIAISVALLVL